MVNLSSFREVQAAFLMLTLLFTFARTESPLPKAVSGAGQFDATQHWGVEDVQVTSLEGKRTVGLRMKAIKQDQRMERPEAAGNEDWVWIGDVDDQDFSICRWLQLVFAFHGAARLKGEPFFVQQAQAAAPGGARPKPLTYAQALSDVRKLWAR